MDNGWIKLHRKIEENKYYLLEKFTKIQAWIDLIIIANHKDRIISVRGNEILVKRGQVGWANETLAKRWKWSRGKVERFLKNLEENDCQIKQQKNNIITLITIKKYEQYQSDNTTNRATDERQTSDRQSINKNDKNDKNKYIATKVADSKKDDEIQMDYKGFVEWSAKSNQRAVRLIGEWADTIRPSFKTKGQWRVFIKRNLRPANDLAKFTDEQIAKAFSEIQKSKDWLKKPTLETIIKFLN